MLHSGSYATRRADNRVRSGSIGNSRRRTDSDTTTLKFATPSSAFSTPSPSSKRSANAAIYGSPPSHHHEKLTRSRPNQVVHRSSPTSVTATAIFNGGLCSELPYGDDVNSYEAVERQANLDVRPSKRYNHAALTARHGRFRQASVEAGRNVTVMATAAVCLPCKPEMPTVARNADSVKSNYSSSQNPGSGRGGRSNRRSSNHRGPNIAAGDGGERPPPTSGNNGGGHNPTPQNLRDNPERLAKVKSEMCHFYDAGGVDHCPFGANCNYAHGKHELQFRYTSLCLMESSGKIADAKTYLARPCMTWVSTGACPFGRRCAAIHDPSISGPVEYPSWLPIATAKTNAQIIVDRLGAHRENVVHQENPLVAQSIWENCRPSQRGHHKGRVVETDFADYASMSILDMEQEWSDTYALVCNSGVPIFNGGLGSANAPSTKLSDLRKLCIARLMHGKDDDQESASSQRHRDYVFGPTHSLNSELCMILQARYFLLLDVNCMSAANVSAENVVKEISFDEYKSRTFPWSGMGHRFDPSNCVTAHEVAFAPKGGHSANVSIWFDVSPIKLEQSQIKRSRRLKQKKKAQIRNEHRRPNANGALISRTSSADFPTGPPYVDPFVPMLPAEDDDRSQCLIMAIIEHRIDSIILNNCSSVDGEQKKRLYVRMKQLQQAFLGMAKFHDKWTWPKRVGMGNVTVTTKAPPGNIMPYIPLENNKKTSALHLWHTFVKTIGTDHSSEIDNDTKRLGTFLSIVGSVHRTDSGVTTSLPHILPDMWWNAEVSSPKKVDTWKEILLGMPENGKWEAALRLHNKKREGSFDKTTEKAGNTPLSTIPFVQA